MSGISIPPEVKQMADGLGIDLEKLLSKELTPENIAHLAGVLGVDANALIQHVNATPAAPHPAAAAQAAMGSGVAVASSQGQNIPAEVADGVHQQEGPSETAEQRLERELAVSRQETQQARSSLQTLTEARVVGNSGLSGPVAPQVPTLAEIEPGIRYAVRNGLIDAEQLGEKFGQTIVDLFKADLGGVI